MASVSHTPLLLVPTEMELGLLERALDSCPAHQPRLCGLGPIVAAARAAQLIASERPERVLLAGIGGSYGQRLAVGKAYVFAQVGCYGIGVGSGADFRPAGAMGWPQGRFPESREMIHDQIDLDIPSGLPPDVAQTLLLTVASAAAEPNDCGHRLKWFPAAMAEDMEAFGVAVACRLAEVPLTVIRGISNQAGDRNKNNWQIESALRGVAKLISQILAK